MADSCSIEKTGTIVGVIHRILSVLIVIASIVIFIMGIHWISSLVFIAIAVALYFAATRFVNAIRTTNPSQTIFFISVSTFLLVTSALYFYLLLEGLFTGEFFGNKYIYYPSPIVLLFQLFTTYVSFKVYQKLKGAAPQSNA